MDCTIDTLWRNVEAVRDGGPLVHNITNYVAMNTSANALLAVGGSPVMIHAREEVVDMASVAQALVVNIGTFEPLWEEAMTRAIETARGRGIPVVIDPVGAGATGYRNEALKRLLAVAPPTLIRANASEVGAVAHGMGIDAAPRSHGKGVDATDSSDAMRTVAEALAMEVGCVVAMSGERDYVVDATRSVSVANGSALMPKVTALGCSLSAVCGAFCAVEEDPWRAAVHASIYFAVAGEVAAERAAGPGSLQMHLLDVLATVSREEVARRMRVEAVR